MNACLPKQRTNAPLWLEYVETPNCPSLEGFEMCGTSGRSPGFSMCSTSPTFPALRPVDFYGVTVAGQLSN